MAKTSTSWKPGQSGNPKGPPRKKDSITHLMNEFLKTKAPGDKRTTYREIFVKKVFQKAMQGDIPAIRLIWNYIDGMPSQNLNIGGQTDNPLLTKEISKKELKEIKELIKNFEFENE